MSAKFYKSPAVIFEEQIPLLAKEITGIPRSYPPAGLAACLTLVMRSISKVHPSS